MNLSVLRYFILLVFCTGFSINAAQSQTHTSYEISFENAVHHEAEVSATFSNLDDQVLELRMSRSSPGRYALHEFAKNIYGVKATDSKGNELKVIRPNPHQWNVVGHDGTVHFNYTIFANRGDGTYAQVDETHAHLNTPAVFIWARNYEHRPIQVKFNLRKDLNWKVATQLQHQEGTTYTAPDLAYFLDSPIEIADFHERAEQIDGQTIRLALHTPASDQEVDTYFEQVMAIVKAQKNVFGELPQFDYGEYVFLSCYMPNASGDGMEHRNSTVVTSSKPLDRPLGKTGLGTVSHEFIHIWNVERIRPASLEPFNFEEANMSGELWFAEGFTSYYTGLILARAGIDTGQEYVAGLTRGLNFVINHPGRAYFNPIEMSYQAPFVDAATSVEPQNKENTFISYYTYGSVIGLALDLSLREMGGGKSLDGFMSQMWKHYGKPEIPYTNRDIQATLAAYAGEEFAANFFNNYIFDSQMPDYTSLLANVGVGFEKSNPGKASLGTSIRIVNGVGKLRTNALKGSPIYKAGISGSDEIIAIGGKQLSDVRNVDEILQNFRPGDSVDVSFTRWGQQHTAKVKLVEDDSHKTVWDDKASSSKAQRRAAWLTN